MSFNDQLKQALKDFHTPSKLAGDSALATAYFLSSALPDYTEKLSWAEILRRELLAAADSLWDGPPPIHRRQVEERRDLLLQQPGSGPYYYYLLELRYFNRFFHPRSLSQIWTDFTRQSRAEFYRDLHDATTALGDALLSRLQPGVRLDTPPPVPRLFGREGLLDECSRLLADGALALHGPGGIGKSTAAAALAARWQAGPIFWYTVRPELSDGLHHLLYALAGFFQRHGASRLWRLLAAQAGEAGDLHLLYHQARADCAELNRPLLCFDDVDLWPEEAAPIWQILAGLEEPAALLYVGQRRPDRPVAHRRLAPLTADEGVALLRSAGVEQAESRAGEILRQSGGNPRLLWLAADLLRRDPSEGELAAGGDLLFQSYLLHLWPRLRADEQEMLQALSVFHAPAPADAFDPRLLLDLAARHLLLNDGQGGVSLLPALRDGVKGRLDREAQAARHAQAAAIYGSRAEYTLAAWHWQQANQPLAALQLWFPHRQREIRRGQADTAKAIFLGMDEESLPADAQKNLRLLRAELHKLAGASQAGLAELAGTWPPDDERSLDAQRLRGDLLDALGETEAAQEAYADGLSIAAGLLAASAELHGQRARAYVRQRNLAEAWQQAQQARYSAEQLYGLVMEARGELDGALTHYERALALAEEADLPAGQAETLRCLSKIYGMRGELDRSVGFARQAIAIYEGLSDLVSAARVRSNLAANYLDARRFAEVIETGAPALEFFQASRHPHGIAATACNLAEAWFELGDGEQARRHATLALAQEEPQAAPYALYTLALLAERENEPAQAEATLRRCIAAGEANDDRFIQAYTWLQLARLLGGAARRQAAAQSATLFAQLGIDGLAQQARELSG